MIKETTKKINFIAYHPKRGRTKDTSRPPTINVFGQEGRMQFTRYAVEQMKMDGKFVRFFYEPIKNIIGWKVVSEVESQAELKLWRMCKTHNNGIWQVSIKRMLDEFQSKKTGTLAVKYKNLEVQKYRELGLLTKPNETYFFVELKEELKSV